MFECLNSTRNKEPGTNCIEDFQIALHEALSEALYEINDSNWIKSQTTKIKDTAKFSNLLKDSNWSNRFVKSYCLGAFVNYLTSSYFSYSSYRRDHQELLKQVKRYKLNHEYYRIELKNSGYEEAIINFYDQIITKLSKSAELFSSDPICRNLEDNVRQLPYNSRENSILRFEKFLSANSDNYIISVYAVDTAGNKSSSKIVKVIDKTVPSVPTVNKISSKSVTATGKSEKGASIYIYNGSKKIGQGIVDSRGNYKVKIKTQKKGSALKVYAQDKVGNKSKSRTVKVS